MNRIALNFILLIILFSNLRAQDYLIECFNKQVKPLEGKNLMFSFRKNFNQLEHSFEPWQQTNYKGKGTIWINADCFLKNDTLSKGVKNYFSKTQFSKTEFLLLDYGSKQLSEVTKNSFLEVIIQTLSYSPLMMINYFVNKNISPEKESNSDFAIYKTAINKNIVKLFIKKSNHLVSKISTLSDDELFGDVLSTFNYGDYTKEKQLFYPTTVSIQKINGRLSDEVKISAGSMVNEIPKLLETPSDYKIKDDIEIAPEIKIEKYNNNIYFIELKHTDDKIMVVEFNNFLLVAEAPLNSKNGELIISEAKKIAPNKPLKYFVFGHYHPHYLGGVRAFIHKGAKILCVKSNEEYLKYIADAPRTLNEDSLQMQPKKLLVEEVKDSTVISDRKFTMKVYFIGRKSEHTNDYLIYYFPSEKLIFEDDLVWIAKEGEIKKASKRQTGLYNSIKELHLEVKIIIQSWPVLDYGVKTIIPFTDLEKSVKME